MEEYRYKLFKKGVQFKVRIMEKPYELDCNDPNQFICGIDSNENYDILKIEEIDKKLLRITDMNNNIQDIPYDNINHIYEIVIFKKDTRHNI